MSPQNVFIKGSFMGSTILTPGEGEGAPTAAGGHSTETSCLCIMLVAGWREDWNFWQGVGNAEADCTQH